MRKFQKATAVIMAAALAATGCSSGGAKTSDTQQPSGTEAAKTEAAGDAAKTEAAKDAASGEEEPVLVVYTARSEALNNAVIPEFEKDTGIKVEVVVAGTGELLKRAQSEKDNPLGDIFWVADQTMLSASKDLFMEYVSPEDENMLDAFRNTTGYFTPAFADPTVMIVNKDLKGDMKIEGFEDLLNPELKVNIVLGISVMLSTGSNAIVAKKMGEGRPDSARETFTTIILLNIIIGLVFAVLGNLAAVPLSRMLGASDLLLKDCVTYLRWQLAFAPSLMLQIQFQMFFVTEGKPGIGLFLTLLAGIANAVLDYVLIVPMGMGIAGAAIATVTGYSIPALIGLIYFAAARKSLWFVRPRIVKKELGETCLNGSSEMVTNLSSGVITFLFNLLMMHFAGEDGVAAITIIQYSQFLLNALFMGFSQGVSPVISFNYGSQNHQQLRQVFKTSLIFTAASSLAVFLMAQLGGSLVVEIFARRGTPVYELARHGFMIFACSFLFSGFTIFASALFTALSDGRISAIISFVRTFGLIITSLLVLPFIIGMDGVWLAIPIAEFGGILLCLYFLRKYRTKYHYA